MHLPDHQQVSSTSMTTSVKQLWQFAGLEHNAREGRPQEWSYRRNWCCPSFHSERLPKFKIFKTVATLPRRGHPTKFTPKSNRAEKLQLTLRCISDPTDLSRRVKCKSSRQYKEKDWTNMAARRAPLLSKNTPAQLRFTKLLLKLLLLNLWFETIYSWDILQYW